VALHFHADKGAELCRISLGMGQRSLAVQALLANQETVHRRCASN
jgi:hypothetical protein